MLIEILGLINLGSENIYQLPDKLSIAIVLDLKLV